MSFAGYSFCKPHSASYAQVSFKSAYLRAHYPAEFIAAVISNQGGFYSAFAYLSEARRMGLAILPPDVNASDWAYGGEGDRLRIGLMQVKTLPEDARHGAIVKNGHEHGPYRSFRGFSAAREARAGACAGADPRRLLRFPCRRADAAGLAVAAVCGKRRGSGPLPVPDDYPASQKQAHEIESFGFLASRHPLTLYRKPIERLRPVPASQMHRFIGAASRWWDG